MTELQFRRLRLTTPEIAILASGALWGLYWIPLRHLEGRGVDAVWTMRGPFRGEPRGARPRT